MIAETRIRVGARPPPPRTRDHENAVAREERSHQVDTRAHVAAAEPNRVEARDDWLEEGKQRGNLQREPGERNPAHRRPRRKKPGAQIHQARVVAIVRTRAAQAIDERHRGERQEQRAGIGGAARPEVAERIEEARAAAGQTPDGTGLEIRSEDCVSDAGGDGAKRHELRRQRREGAQVAGEEIDGVRAADDGQG